MSSSYWSDVPSLPLSTLVVWLARTLESRPFQSLALVLPEGIQLDDLSTFAPARQSVVMSDLEDLLRGLHATARELLAWAVLARWRVGN